MRIRTQSGPVAEFAAKALEIAGLQTPLQICARINTGCGMALEVNDVSTFACILGVKEMVEADLEQRRQRRIGRDMAADSRIFSIGSHHHGERIPSHQALDPPFDFAITGIIRLLIARDGVY